MAETYGYTLENMAILTDDNEDPRMRPTKTNIIDWMRWLVDGAHKDDALFFH